ncbi:hypothetical protein KZX47_13565 [Thermus sp. SYSU G05001]|uniref:DNA polymerase III beta sliding clamp central domain-containing protein n=1 Tax=Thermus brevis TaxID=2862456 RepID=A0ABS7A1L0_9DEIN|nr:DNA polymerase III subunit beta [Thermus brevis]MBW6396168.1 hypothetical protein [Thermus brevis]
MKLERIIGLIPHKSSDPLLTCLLVEAKNGEVRVRGGNGEMEASAPVGREVLEVEGEGTLLLPRPLAEYLPRARRVVLEGSGVVLELQGGGVIRGQTVAPEGYPEPLWQGEAEVEAALPEPFVRALGGLARFTAREDFRAIFRGVQLELKGRGVRAVASDGYRLGLVEAPLEGLEVDPPVHQVLPRWSLEGAIRLLSGPVRLSVGRGRARLAGEGLEVALTAMEGEYPNYERVIPKEPAFRVRVVRESALAVLDEALDMSDPQNRRVDLAYDGQGWALEAEGPYGRGRWPFPARLEEGGLEAGTWVFNGRHLRETLAWLEVPEIEGWLSVPGPSPAPTLWRGEWQGLRGLVVLAPLRV